MSSAVRFVAAILVSLGLALAPLGAALAQQAVPVQFVPVGSSTVTGTASITVQGGAASVGIALSGLTPGASYTVSLQAGTCAMPSASAGRLGDLKADAAGNGRLAASSVTATAAGVQVALTPELLLDGNHVLVVSAQDVVACGSIPSAGAGQLPAAGGLPVAPLAGALGALGLSTLLLGWRLRRR